MVKARILVVEDDERIVRMLSRYLEARGYAVAGTSDAVMLADVIAETLPDLLLLDWMLPSKSGIETLRELRKEAHLSQLPVIMLTARDDELDRVEGLLTGADDYVTKPFSLAELEARITSVLRRAARQVPGYKDDVVDIQPAQKTISVMGKDRSLSLHEWAVLEKLLSTPGVVSRIELMEHVWGAQPPSSERSIDNLIMRLRRLIEPDETSRYIVTERGSGYRFARRNG